MGLFPALQLRLLGLILFGLFPVGTLSYFPTQSAGTLSVGTLSILTASVGTLSCWGSFRSDSFHHPLFCKSHRVGKSEQLENSFHSGQGAPDER